MLSRINHVIIRNEQMDVFQREAEASFHSRLCRYLREDHANVTDRYPDPIFQKMVAGGIERAQSRGLTLENKIAFFVALMFEIAPNFDQHPRIGAMLEDPASTPDSAMDRLTQELTGRDWAQAARNSNPSAWGRGDASG